MSKMTFSRIRRDGDSRRVDVDIDGRRAGELYRRPGMEEWAADDDLAESIAGHTDNLRGKTLADAKAAVKAALVDAKAEQAEDENSDGEEDGDVPAAEFVLSALVIGLPIAVFLSGFFEPAADFVRKIADLGWTMTWGLGGTMVFSYAHLEDQFVGMGRAPELVQRVSIIAALVGGWWVALRHEGWAAALHHIDVPSEVFSSSATVCCIIAIYQTLFTSRRD